MDLTFSIYLTILSLLCFEKIMRGGAYKIIVSETWEICTLPKGLFPGHTGDRRLTVYSGEIWAKIPKNTPVSKK